MFLRARKTPAQNIMCELSQHNQPAGLISRQALPRDILFATAVCNSAILPAPRSIAGMLPKSAIRGIFAPTHRRPLRQPCRPVPASAVSTGCRLASCTGVSAVPGSAAIVFSVWGISAGTLSVRSAHLLPAAAGRHSRCPAAPAVPRVLCSTNLPAPAAARFVPV